MAIFSHLEYAFTERLTGSLGVRYTSEEKRISNPPGIVPVASNGNSKTFTNLSPIVGMQYFIDQDLQIYGSISRGFKSGGFNNQGSMATVDLFFNDTTKDHIPSGLNSSSNLGHHTIYLNS